MRINKENSKLEFNKNLKNYYQAKSVGDLSGIELYNCFSRTVIGYFLDDWVAQ